MAPAHGSKRTINFLNSQGLNTWGKHQWPGNSPDFNVIEHLWHRLQDSVLVEPRPTNRAQLIDRVTETWNLIPVSDLEKLVESMLKRIEECKKSNGHHTHY